MLNSLPLWKALQRGARLLIVTVREICVALAANGVSPYLVSLLGELTTPVLVALAVGVLLGASIGAALAFRHKRKRRRRKARPRK
jgi:uncharacterized membrane protein YfcA